MCGYGCVFGLVYIPPMLCESEAELTFGFTYVLFVTGFAGDEVNDIFCCAVASNSTFVLVLCVCAAEKFRFVDV